MPQRVRKAVLPVAGLGTRFLPATKAMPKEMLTVVDRPLIQYAVEECLAAGIEEFVFVTGRNKSAIEDHFDAAYELEATLERARQEERAEADAGRRHQARQRDLHPPAEAARPRPRRVVRARLDRPRAVRRAAARRAHDRFAEPARRSSWRRTSKTGGNVVAVMDVPREQTKSYGIAAVKAGEGRAGRDHRPGREAQARGGALDARHHRPLRADARGVRPSRQARDRRRRRDPAHRRHGQDDRQPAVPRPDATPASATIAAPGWASSRPTVAVALNRDDTKADTRALLGRLLKG